MAFHDDLQRKIDEFAHSVYRVTRSFPKEETYGLTSQFRRAAVSIALNYTEGYARVKNKVHKNFLEISYGSLKECQYLVEFCYKEKLIETKDYEELKSLSDDIGAMLWGILKKI